MAGFSFGQTKPKAPVKKATTTKKTVKKPVTTTKPAAPKNDTTYYYYTNKKVSVKVAPWKDGNQTILFYNYAGQVTYTLENSRNHGTTSNELKFRPDGSVESVAGSTMPDGGIYGYKSTTTFSNLNVPEWRTSEKYPMTTLELPIKYYWDAKTGQWKRQETQECNPPRGF